MGSPHFNTLECGSFLVTSAFFPAGHAIGKHFHERTVVGVTLEGTWTSVLGATRLANAPGILHVEPAGDSHSNQFTSNSRVAIIQPDPKNLRLAHSFGSLLTTAGQAQVGLHGILIARRLCHELQALDDLTPLAIESLSLELLVASKRTSSRPGAPPTWLSRSVEYLHSHFLQRPTLVELGDIAEVSAEEFNREFRRNYRMGPAKYARLLRLNWAAEKLVGCSESLAEIASRSGFADQSHFTRHFKQQFGVTPAAFRAGSRKA